MGAGPRKVRQHMELEARWVPPCRRGFGHVRAARWPQVGVPHGSPEVVLGETLCAEGLLRELRALHAGRVFHVHPVFGDWRAIVGMARARGSQPPVYARSTRDRVQRVDHRSKLP